MVGGFHRAIVRCEAWCSVGVERRRCLKESLEEDCQELEMRREAKDNGTPQQEALRESTALSGSGTREFSLRTRGLWASESYKRRLALFKAKVSARPTQLQMIEVYFKMAFFVFGFCLFGLLFVWRHTHPLPISCCSPG